MLISLNKLPTICLSCFSNIAPIVLLNEYESIESMNPWRKGLRARGITSHREQRARALSAAARHDTRPGLGDWDIGTAHGARET